MGACLHPEGVRCDNCRHLFRELLPQRVDLPIYPYQPVPASPHEFTFIGVELKPKKKTIYVLMWQYHDKSGHGFWGAYEVESDAIEAAEKLQAIADDKNWTVNPIQLNLV